MSVDVPVPELADRAVRCADRLRAADRVLLVSHIDADGLTSAAVAASALERAGIPFEAVFSKQLDADEIAAIAEREESTVLFTDLGSGQLQDIVEHEERGAFTPVIADHHQPADAETEFHCNPLLEGIDGASELSGAGTAYVLARALSSGSQQTASATANRDLAPLAVVGAVGDMQASGGELHGANAAIVEEGEAAGVLETATDLALYGRQTRPLPKFLEYASDVRIPGITGDERGTLEFLDGLGLDLHDDDGEWRPWADLTAEERERVASSLLQRAVERGVRPRKVDSLVGTSYTLTEEAVGTALRDVSEFSTLLNATARYERADVGLAVCLGNRDGALDRARTLLSNHRRNLSEGLNRVKERGVTREEHCQWFHAEDEIRPTIVGIVAGMAVGVDGVERGVPILAFATDDDGIKVSARGTPGLVRQGLDLSAVMGEAAPAVGGEGGGHDVAAGATIPPGTEDEFVDHADRVIGEQLE
jgi:RecJ-like exonuclease